MLASRSLVASTSQVRPASAGLSSTSRMSGKGFMAVTKGSIGSDSRQREPKNRSPFTSGFDPDSASVLLHDLFADRQAQPVTGVLVARMQPLKNDKDLFAVFRRDAYPIVFNGNLPSIFLKLCGYVDRRGCPLAELDGVADQVLKKLYQMNLVAVDER